MEILTVPNLDDNFCYLICVDGKALVIDPGEAIPVLDVLHKHGLSPYAILITHHHMDHRGGVAGILQAVGAHLPVYASTQQTDYINWRNVTDKQSLTFPFLDAPIEVHAASGHTQDHVIYRLADNLFVGDVLFGAGAGRLFEGDKETFAQTYIRFCQFEPNCKIYFGHEYTHTNLRFATEIEPLNKDTQHRLATLTEPSTPSSMAEELKTNPFLRHQDEQLQTEVKKRLPLDDFDPTLMPYYVRLCKDEWDSMN